MVWKKLHRSFSYLKNPFNMATLLKRPDLCDPGLVTRFRRFHFTKIMIKPTCWAPLPFFFILGTVCHNILHSLVKNQYKKFRNGFEFPTWFPSFLKRDKSFRMSVWVLILSSLNFSSKRIVRHIDGIYIHNQWLVCWIQNWLSSRSPCWSHSVAFFGKRQLTVTVLLSTLEHG